MELDGRILKAKEQFTYPACRQEMPMESRLLHTCLRSGISISYLTNPFLILLSFRKIRWRKIKSSVSVSVYLQSCDGGNSY
jgi:hypothetical protein